MARIWKVDFQRMKALLNFRRRALGRATRPELAPVGLPRARPEQLHQNQECNFSETKKGRFCTSQKRPEVELPAKD
jgi:hypothetical protein